MVNNLQIAFDRGRRKYFDQSSSDEEQVLLEYPPIDNSNRLNVNKSKDVKVEKSKQQKEKKIVQSEDESENEQKNEKGKHKKVKNLKNKQESKETEKKSEKTMNSDESKKNKSTKGVKRKSSKSKDHVKSKKVKKEIDKETENSESEEEEQKNEDVVKSKDKEKDKKKKKNVLKQKNVKTNKIENSSNDKKNSSKKNSHHVKNEKGSKTSKKSKDAVVEKSFHESSDDDDYNSVRDLIEEKVEKKPETSKKQKKSSDQHNSSKAEKKPKLMIAESLDNRKNGSKKSKKQNKKLSKENDLPSSPTSSRSSSPLLTSSAGIVDDFNSSFDSSDRRFDNLLRSETPEIKDKFDLIKERRNRMNQQKQKEQKVPKAPKNSSALPLIEKHKSKEKPAKFKSEKEKTKKSQELDTSQKTGTKTKEKDKDANSLFDKLKNEELEDKKKVGDKSHSKKNKVKADDNKKESKSSGSHKAKEEVKDGKHHLPKNKKQNRASLDVLDMETEQTLKDINKWLEHTPRFEYSSASNSPSRYVIDELDMPSKLDDDFRKPIPLMPSSPSASQTNFHSPKDLNLLKESNNNNKNTSSLNQLSGNSKKNNNKETKRKNSRDKLLQNVPKKKEVQRTIDRLQPGKTKGNLLNNIQNINKPDEIYPLGNREKLKEVKNSLFVETDESSPKLSLGTVLDNQSFNLIDCEKISKNEKFGSLENEDDVNDLKSDCPSPKKMDDLETLTTEDVKLSESATTTKTENSSKPNLVNTNAWFKAFGAPKKPKKIEEDTKVKESEGMNPEGNYIPSQTRRLSTGSSISERSSESSPHVGIDERGAPAPYPSPIGTSPMPSPKIEEPAKPSSSSYGVNGSTRVGFYQDMTSIKSSPEKSCSPREAPYSQYSQQSHYSGTSPSTTSPHYGSFYPENPSPGHPNQQASYSKPTHSPAAPYYDQYKQPMSQESDFNNSMSPNTNPNSPYHSQQSSPYQQQPNSPFQSANPISSTNTSSSYTQPTSPYHQQQPATVQKAQQSQFAQSPNSPNNIQKAQISDPNPVFPTHPPLYQQHTLPNSFDQSHRPAQEPQYQPPGQKSEWNTTQQAASYASQQQPNPPINTQGMTTTQNNPPNQITQEIYSQSQDYNTNKKKTLNDLENAAARVFAESNKSVDLPNPAYPTAVEKVKDTVDVIDNNKYLDLSKQVPPAVASHPQHLTQPMNQYQQMFDLSNYSKHGMDYDLSKSKSAEAYSRPPVDKSHVPMPPSASGFWGNNKHENPEYNAIQAEHAKVTSAVPSHQQVRGASIDPNYKPPIFNNPATSSMMDLTAFMRDFRHPDERFSALPGTPGYYDKNIPPAAHMFSKNLPQTATSAALQQMFNNSMNTMSYSRDQQSNSHNRWNTPQGSMTNLNPPSVPTSTPVAAEVTTKPKKQRKSKKNASPEPAPALHSNYQSQAANQYQQQHSHHQQQISHQQPPFQSYGGLKITPNSADTLKAVGSAFMDYGPAPTLTGLYGDNSAAYLDDFRNAAAASNPYYPPPPGLAHRSTPESQHDKTGVNPPAAHPQTPTASPYHHLLPAHHPSRSSYPFMNTLDPATLQQQYRMMLNQTYQGYHPALSMHNQWPHHM